MVQKNEPQATIRPIVVAPITKRPQKVKKPEATLNKELTSLLHIMRLQ